MTKILKGGDINKGLARALKLVDRDTISGIEANYSYQKSLLVEHTEIQETSTYSKEGVAEKVISVADSNFDYTNKLIDEIAERSIVRLRPHCLPRAL